MQTTKEDYFLTRNVMRVQMRNNKLLHFIKTHKILIVATFVFLSLIIVEGVLLHQFIKLLLFL